MKILRTESFNPIKPKEGVIQYIECGHCQYQAYDQYSRHEIPPSNLDEMFCPSCGKRADGTHWNDHTTKPMDNALIEKVGDAIPNYDYRGEHLTPWRERAAKAAIQAYEAHLSAQGRVIISKKLFDQLTEYFNGNGLSADEASEVQQVLHTLQRGDD